MIKQDGRPTKRERKEGEIIKPSSVEFGEIDYMMSQVKTKNPEPPDIDADV
jgi:hypothetical protein